VEFKFKVGEVVKHKALDKVRFFIVERRRHECSRGTQDFYLVRGFFPITGGTPAEAIDTRIIEMTEIELEKV